MPMLIDVAELAGLALEGALYGALTSEEAGLSRNCALTCRLAGVFLCLFLVCAFDLLKRRARGKATLNWPVSVAGILLIVLATARFSVDTANVFVAFISHDPREARIAYLADPTQPLFTTKHSILICVLLVGDSFVVSIFSPHSCRMVTLIVGTELSLLDRLGKEALHRPIPNCPLVH